MIISCHQPNLLPWTPYFEKIQQSDLFVILENVQFTRHQFQNRFEYQGKWQTMPVERGHLNDLIKDKKYLEPFSSWNRVKRSVAKTQLSQFDELISENLSRTNTLIIDRLCQMMKINTPMIKDTKSDQANASQKLLEICLKHGATTYLSGPSGRNYLNEDIFTLNGIEIRYFEPKNREHILERIG
jgi:hypothetical protein